VYVPSFEAHNFHDVAVRVDPGHKSFRTDLMPSRWSAILYVIFPGCLVDGRALPLAEVEDTGYSAHIYHRTSIDMFQAPCWLEVTISLFYWLLKLKEEVFSAP
jgi:hypothetical protein